MATKPNRIAAFFIGILGFLGVGVATGILYVVFVGKILNRGGDGFGLVGAIITFPLYLVLAGLGWLALWHLHTWKFGLMPAGRVIVGSMLFGLVISLVFAGPRGFTMHGGSALFNYFLIAGMIAGAWVHHGICRRLARRRGAPLSAAPNSPPDH